MCCEHVLSLGLTVNGLPIEVSSDVPTTHPSSFDNVTRFYMDCVIGGPGAFHLVARGFGDVRETLIMKLMLEMAELPAEQKHQIAAAWNRNTDTPVAQVIPAMVLDLSPNGARPGPSQTNCDAHESPVFVP